MKTRILSRKGPSHHQLTDKVAHVEVNGKILGPLLAYSKPYVSPDFVQAQESTLNAPDIDAHMAKIPEAIIEIPDVEAGEFRPRIWRSHVYAYEGHFAAPAINHIDYAPTLISALEQIEILVEHLNIIFRSTHPDPLNYKSYGSSIRDVLILACMEVEAQCKGILKANDFRTKKDEKSWNSDDYSKLNAIMRLDQYEVGLVRYLHYPVFSPFAGWSSPGASQSLPWYAAYNKVKQDREDHFREATLQNAITGVGACWVMLVAQYGPSAVQQFVTTRMFHFTKLPEWEPKYWSFGPMPGSGWTPSKLTIS